MKAIKLSMDGVLEWLWETLMVDGKMLFDVSDKDSVVFGMKVYSDAVVIFANESNRRIQFGEMNLVFEKLYQALPLATSIYASGQAEQNAITSYSHVSEEELNQIACTEPSEEGNFFVGASATI